VIDSRAPDGEKQICMGQFTERKFQLNHNILKQYDNYNYRKRKSIKLQLQLRKVEPDTMRYNSSGRVCLLLP